MTIFKRFNLKRKNTIFSLIKYYLLFLLFIFLLTFIVITINKPKIFKEPEKKLVIKKIKRSIAYNRALDIINYVWEYNSYRNGNNNKDIILPSYLINKTAIRTCGIPYCWGGFFSIDKSNDINVKNFQEAVDRGYTTGNILCSGEYKNLTAGLDCSGFVSAVFDLDEKCATYTMKDYFKPIDIKDIKPMDIFNSERNHTFIYIKESYDKKGIITMEATTGKSGRDKTVVNYRSFDEIQNQVKEKIYMPMRYKGIIDDDVELFKDYNEYNDTIEHAVLVKDKICGFIEYGEDVDYFYIEKDKDIGIFVDTRSIPNFCIIYVLDEKEKEIATIRKGIYYINIKRGKTYFKIISQDFKYSLNEGYEIYIK